MKNILKAVAITAAIIGMSGSVAFADTTCTSTINGTGQGSTNVVNCVDNNNNQVTCNNNVVVTSTNNQGASSGGANSSGHTTGGGATSGTATNTNSSVVTVGASCAPVAGGNGGDFTVVDTPSTPQVLADQVTVKPVGGAGAGAGAGVASSNAAATTGIIGSAALIALGVAIRKGAFNRN